MTRRERLRRCYLHQELDRPAVYSRRGFPKNDPGYAELIAWLDAHTEVKLPCRSWEPRGALPALARTEPHSADFERRVEVLPTPKGDLQLTHLVSLKGQPGLHETFLLKGPEDAEKYLSLPVPEVVVHEDAFREADARAGDAGMADVSLGMNPAGFTAELFGSEAFAMMTIEARDLVHALCERRMRLQLDAVRALAARGIGPHFNLLGEEMVVPPLHGPRDFQDFNVRYDKPIIDLVHETGGSVHVHCHGPIRQVFRGFLDMGADVLHPIEPPPMGDLPAKEAKAMARGRLCLEGNLQIHRLYEASAEEVRAETEQLIRDAFDDRRGLIVSPSASPYIRGKGPECFPRYKAMVEAVLGWKG
jgi:hypothetical protein